MERHFCASFAVKAVSFQKTRPVTLDDLREANSNGLDKKKERKEKEKEEEGKKKFVIISFGWILLSSGRPLCRFYGTPFLFAESTVRLQLSSTS